MHNQNETKQSSLVATNGDAQKIMDIFSSGYTYETVSKLTVSKEESDKLKLSFDPKLLQIKPDGIVYLPGMFYKFRLIETFGAGSWGILPKIKPFLQDDVMHYWGALFIRGCFVSEAVGEQKYHASNNNMTKASAIEGAKTDCIVRCCKDLGINYECWDPEFLRQWITDNGIRVVIKPKSGDRKIVWRKKSQPPFYNEIMEYKDPCDLNENASANVQSNGSSSSNGSAVEYDIKEFDPRKEKFGKGKLLKDKLWIDVSVNDLKWWYHHITDNTATIFKAKCAKTLSIIYYNRIIAAKDEDMNKLNDEITNTDEILSEQKIILRNKWIEKSKELAKK